MEAYKKEFIQFLEREGVLKFGDFTAKSGRKIPYFVNAGMIKTGSAIATRLVRVWVSTKIFWASEHSISKNSPSRARLLISGPQDI